MPRTISTIPSPGLLTWLLALALLVLLPSSVAPVQAQMADSIRTVLPIGEKLKLVVTRNAADRIGEAIAAAGIEPEIVEPRNFDAHVALDSESVHQGAALEVKPLHWGSLPEVCVSGRGAVSALISSPRGGGGALGFAVQGELGGGEV